jgi:hypothetical protein
MPTPSTILALLGSASHGAMGLAIAWHAIVAWALLALLAGWHPGKRTGALLLVAPLLSVAAVSIAYASPFNAVVFGAGVVALVILALRAPEEPATLRSRPYVALGAAMLVFGWVYPHFLADLPRAVYLYAAPLGVVPCATLSLVIGFVLLANVGDRAWVTTLAALGVFYGLFGVAVLHVWIDVALILGAAAAMTTGWVRSAQLSWR